MSHATCERAKKIMVKGSDDQKQAFRYAGVVTRKVCGQLQCDERNEELREKNLDSFRAINSGQVDTLVGLIILCSRRIKT
jgi:hypothetical protein